MAASQIVEKQEKWSPNTEVMALYSFRAFFKNCLSFTENEVLSIVKATKDPEWYLARNKDHQEGKIPANYVKKLDPVPSWFHGTITHTEAEELLSSHEDGLFLIRESKSDPGDYTLCLCANNRVEHYHIPSKNNKLTIDGETLFDDLCQLVEHHRKDADDLCIELITPCAGHEGSNINANVLKEQAWTMKGMGALEGTELVTKTNHGSQQKIPAFQRRKQEKWSPNTEVMALYSFRAISNNDLSFTEKEVLIIVKEIWEFFGLKDSVWYLAKNKDGQEGRIPANYVKKICPVPTWFHGTITRTEAEERLSPHEDGLFLIRESRSDPGDYTLCLCANNRVEHYHIPSKNNKLTIEGGKLFDDLSQLVEHHRQKVEGLCMKLITSCAGHDGSNISANVLTEQAWTLKGIDTVERVKDVTESEQWRKRGNAHYLSALDESNQESQCKTLRMAYNCYLQSLETASEETDISSASKNLAVVSMKLASIVEKLGEPVSSCRYFLSEAMINFDKAFKYGKGSQSEVWLQHLKGLYFTCIKENIVYMKEDTPLARIEALEKMAQGMTFEEFHSHCFLEIANILFHMSLQPLQAKDFAKALHYLAECHRPMEEARRLGRDNQYIQDEIRVLEEDVHIQKSVAESLQALKTGEDLLGKTLKDQEELNMDMIFQVFDFYKTAILLSRETEIEVEAIASSKIGEVYDMLRCEDKAKEYTIRSIQLAHSLHPKSFTDEEWFKRSRCILEKYQWKVRRQEQIAQQKEREAYVKELSAEMKLLDDHSMDSDHKFIQFVYETFKPIKQSQTLNTKALDEKEGDPPEWQKALKKLYLKANLHYHPDKQSGEERKHVVLFEEITKRLNARYNSMKGIEVEDEK